jgi:adenylosuccinate lyase
MGKVWEPYNRFAKWLQVEILVCEAMAKEGMIPLKSLDNIKKKANFSIDRIKEIEREAKHDVIAFLTNVEECVGPDARFIHVGLTSSDILDTALALQLKEAMQIIIDDIRNLLVVLKDRAFEHKNTVMIGRSHGIHAEPITFGLKLAVWYSEMKRNLGRLEQALDVIGYGKISGAVGTFANVSPKVEKYVCDSLGLKPAEISTQIIQRDRHAQYFTALAILAGSIEKIAVEIRHLQRTEVGEVEEAFTPGQKGSSAMPHKKNPIGSENLSGLARLVRSYCVAAMENIPLWHERDISHSSVERVIAPDSTILIDFMLNRLTRMIKNLVVKKDNMARTSRYYWP